MLKKNNSIKLSFDVDGTIMKPIVSRYAKDLVDRGFDVWITTRRYENLDRYDKDFQRRYGIINLELEHNALFGIAKEIGIPRDKIRFTNMDDKYKFFGDKEGFLWHLDDDQFECNDINEYTKTKAIQCNSGNWMSKCERLIKNKLNENNLNCKHKKAYYFHDNAPMYCPECDNYIDGSNIITKVNNNDK